MGSPRVSGSINASNAGDQLGVVLDQPLPSGSRVPDALDGQGWLMKVLKSTIEGRAGESRKTGDEGEPSSPQLFGIDGSDQVLLSLIQVGKQRSVFLLQFFFSAHTGSIPR